MKKKVLCLLGAVVFATGLFAQVMSSSGANNTLSASFGRGYDNVNDNHSGMTRFHGFIDTFQIRVDVGKFTTEAMLNWGILSKWNDKDNWYLSFENTKATPFWYSNHFYQGGWWSNGNTESYYVNFFVHPVKGLDIGAGTRLNWRVGVAPSSGANFWDSKVHVIQGGLKDADPGSADVAGFAYYANKYTSHYNGNTNAAIGIRYKYNDLFEIGMAIPNGINTNSFAVNAGFNIHPVDFLSASIAYDGIGQSTGNLFIGSSLYFRNLTLDLYIAGNFRNKAFNKSTGKWAVNNDRVGFGATATILVPSINLVIKPELGFMDYMHPDYTMSWNVGSRFDITFAKDFNFGLWMSFAGGARNKTWANVKATENYDGGFIFNIHPDFTWNINKRHSLNIFYDYQNRKDYKDNHNDVWNAGMSWSYRY